MRIQYMLRHKHMLTGVTGYILPKRITSLEPLGGFRQNEKQTDRQRGGGAVEKDKMSHERVYVRLIKFHVS